jgi:hypothetical protein
MVVLILRSDVMPVQDDILPNAGCKNKFVASVPAIENIVSSAVG